MPGLIQLTMRAAVKERMRSIGFWLARSLTALGFLTAAVTLIPPQWYAGFLARPWAEPQGKVLIVLGGDSLENGALGESSLWRCVFAAEVWRSGQFERLIITGDSGNAAAMADYLVWRGIPREALIVDDQSNSTRSNALNAARLAQGMSGPFVLLTSDFHMWRARRAFAQAGFEVAARSCPDAFKRSGDLRNRWRVFLDLMAEFAKIGYYRTRGWI